MALMQRIVYTRPWPLHDTAASRALEQSAAAALPAHTLMQRAGRAVARLALAIAPDARTFWIACGPGNNGGDGFEAAVHLKQWGKHVAVTFAGNERKLPADAAQSMKKARDAGIGLQATAPAGWDAGIDAMLGLGSTRPLDGTMRAWADAMNAGGRSVLAVDLPSGLNGATGNFAGETAVLASHTLSLLTLKPGLFTAHGRDAAGEIWFDDLGVGDDVAPASAWLSGPPRSSQRLHASHKGSYGDVAVIGGAPGMAGAALLAASAALHAGAGRVYAALLDADALAMDMSQPELMLRRWDALDLASLHVACGCGGGEAVRGVLPRVIHDTMSLVLDADALNAIAADSQLQTLLRARGQHGQATVLTPHPLEAARLLGVSTAQVQADRLRRARELSEKFAAAVVLKGSGTVIAAPGATPRINPTGNARLASAGTGDVLAGLVAARMAQGLEALDAAAAAVYEHGAAADAWRQDEALTAGELAKRLKP
jgi:hydroxyethylthiazole kinase-like uncharacterized protein yjeF